MKFGERGIIAVIGYCGRGSLTLVTMQAAVPNDSVTPLPVMTK